LLGKDEMKNKKSKRKKKNTKNITDKKCKEMEKVKRGEKFLNSTLYTSVNNYASHYLT